MLPSRAPYVLPFLMGGLVIKKPPKREAGEAGARRRSLLKFSSSWALELERIVRETLQSKPDMKPLFIPNAVPVSSGTRELHHVMPLIPEVGMLYLLTCARVSKVDAMY